MTWGELKMVTLQKIFAITGDKIVTDDTTNPYIKSMPQVANEALQQLTLNGRRICKSTEITRTAEEAASAGYGYLKIDLYDAVSRFYSLRSEGIFYTDENGNLSSDTDYKIRGGHYLYLPANKAGTWEIWYDAYPKHITSETPDTEEVDTDPECAVIMPLYMASQLYKDDDISMATVWRNEFETALERIINNEKNRVETSESFRCTTGWW